MFGVSLSETIAREKPQDGIPFVLKTLTTFILENGKETAGIFRVTGDANETKKLSETFDTGWFFLA